jgi:hypothetical protein
VPLRSRKLQNRNPAHELVKLCHLGQYPFGGYILIFTIFSIHVLLISPLSLSHVGRHPPLRATRNKLPELAHDDAAHDRRQNPNLSFSRLYSCRSSPVPSVAVPSPAMLRCGCLHRASSILHHGRAPPSSRRLTSPRCRSADPQAGVKRVAAGIEILCGLVAKAHRRWVKSGGGKLWRCRRERLE